MFGSDMPLMDPRIHIGRVVTTEISDVAKEKILGLNATNLLNIKI
ncbi:MAG: amidohydrolase family protein [Candidatus Helarchaeota archaeon]|nr:amidohydrolase family protein [Candidatus Helarchaeota archaeon]